MAFRINKESLADRALLPHVLCKNCVVELNFGQKEEPFFPPPEEFVFIHAVPVEERVRTAVPAKTIEECEVILMVGLPGSGKTQWALKYAKENPEKRYNVLGAETVLNQMRVSCCWGEISQLWYLLWRYPETPSGVSLSSVRDQGSHK